MFKIRFSTFNAIFNNYAPKNINTCDLSYEICWSSQWIREHLVKVRVIQSTSNFKTTKKIKYQWVLCVWFKKKKTYWMTSNSWDFNFMNKQTQFQNMEKHFIK
jgi:hypothetical protein